MAEGSDDASKTEDPTPRRTEEARRKGDVAKSPEVGAFAALLVASAMVLGGGPALCRGMAQALLPFLAHPDAYRLSGGDGVRVLYAAVIAAWPAAVILVAAGVAGAAATLLQQGPVWSPSKLAPDASKIDPFQGFKRLVGIDNLVNFFKSLVKLAAVAAACWWALRARMDTLQGLSALDPAAILPFCAELVRAMAVSVLTATGVLAGADWLWSRVRFTQRMRMSREEVKQDHKDSDGDPHVKARRRQIALERSRRRMAQAVPTATLVVMNPTHYAVALRYVQGETAAPLCVAKGVDSLALKIREIAEAHGVSVVEDPPLARALYAAVEIDRIIPREHYEAVAKLIGFILSAGRSRARVPTAPHAAGR